MAATATRLCFCRQQLMITSVEEIPCVSVAQCDLQEAGFRRVQPKDTGRPGYDPADLLKLYVYGYVNRVRSSRRLEVETTRNLEVMWLLRGLRLDFKTIADFRKDNRHAFEPVFRQFVLLCRKLDLFGRALVAVDGSRLKAVDSTDRNFTREKLVTMIRSADERLADYLSRPDRTDAEENGASGRRAKSLTDKIAALKERKTRHEGLLEELKRTGRSQVSLTDPDSRAMASHPKVGVGYNAQVAFDAKHKLIVEQHVTNAGSDLGLLAPTAGAAKEVLGGERIEAAADRGYYKGEDVQACEDGGLAAYIHPGRTVRDGLFRREEFRYDPTSDTYRCPGGQQLYPLYRCIKGNHTTVQYCNRDACRGCELKPQCTANTYRRVGRWTDGAVLDRMEARLAARPAILKQRREIAEHPFGSIKQWMNQGTFLLRGLEKVRAEFSLTALAYNFIRVVNSVGVATLLKAV